MKLSDKGLDLHVFIRRHGDRFVIGRLGKEAIVTAEELRSFDAIKAQWLRQVGEKTDFEFFRGWSLALKNFPRVASGADSVMTDFQEAA